MIVFLSTIYIVETVTYHSTLLKHMRRRWVWFIVGLFICLDQVRAEKKEKKHFEKQKKAMGLGGGTSMIKPKEPAKPVRINSQLF